jgi:hypothetical protein
VCDQLHGGLLEDNDNLLAATEALYGEAKLAGTGLGDLAAALNGLTGDYSTLQWWGEFSHLCNSDAEFARVIRSSFREDVEDDDEAIGRVVAAEEMDHLVELLAGYRF